jgi:hypothetical protein
VFVTLQVVILIDLLGLRQLTSAFGLINLFHGLGTFLGPPLQGVWFDILCCVYFVNGCLVVHYGRI